MNKLLNLPNVKRILDCRFISMRIAADGKDVPKRKSFENRITLIGADNSVSITDFKNAQNLSIKRELKLVKVQDVDAKTRRPVYKLMTNAEYHSEELEKRKEKQNARQNGGHTKAPKLLTLSCRIGDHDLMTNIKKMGKLLEKGHEVRIILTADTEKEHNTLENMSLQIEKNVKTTGKLLQKRLKGNHMKFQLMPLKTSSSQVSEDNNDTNDNNDIKGGDKGPQ